MGKYHGCIGYATQVETAPGVWTEQITEHEHFGEVLSASFSNQNSTNNANADLRLNNRISIIATPYAIENFHLMRYVTYMGKRWSVSNVEPQYPRLILSVGGVYNAKPTNPA